MHKRFSFENMIFFRFFPLLMVFWLSVSFVCGKDSLQVDTKKGDLYIGNSNFFIVGDAQVFGNSKIIEVVSDKKVANPTKQIKEKKSKDKIRIFKEKKVEKLASHSKPKFFILPLNSENSVTIDDRVRRILIFQTDSYSYQKGKAFASKFGFTFQFYSYKRILFLKTDFSNGFTLKEYDQSIIARPPPNWV